MRGLSPLSGAIALLAALWPFQGGAQTVHGFVQPVSGDTLLLRGSLQDKGGGLLLRLDGVQAVQADQMCGTGERRWSCGMEAALAMADFLGQRGRILCRLSGHELPAVVPERVQEGEEAGPGRFAPALGAMCSTPGGQDLGAFLVREGWATTKDPFLRPAMAEARAARLGIWKGGGVFAPPQEWIRGRLESIAVLERIREEGGISSP